MGGDTTPKTQRADILYLLAQAAQERNVELDIQLEQSATSSTLKVFARDKKLGSWELAGTITGYNHKGETGYDLHAFAEGYRQRDARYSIDWTESPNDRVRMYTLWDTGGYPGSTPHHYRGEDELHKKCHAIHNVVQTIVAKADYWLKWDKQQQEKKARNAAFNPIKRLLYNWGLVD